MEPLPETESLERFRPSPLPTLRPQNPSLTMTDDFVRKPPTMRRSTEPPSPISPSWTPPTALPLPYRPRTTSPLSWAHGRSKSAASLALPGMSRTRSMPGVDGTGRILSSPLFRPASPLGSPNRNRARRKPADEIFPPTSPVRLSVFDGERNTQTDLITGRPRRTSSPLRHAIPPASSSSSSLPSTPASSVGTSPSYRYDINGNSYSFATYYSNSVPTTPTSVRSRSPSISSLETIPDSPDAEEAALEDERIAKAKAASEGSDGEESAGESRSRSGVDVPSRGRTLAYGSRDKRKRWSVCGAERRGDLDLETIWED